MRSITILLVFLAGFAFCEWGMPLLDNIFNTIAIWFQKIQGQMAVKITEDSAKVSKIKQELEDKSNSASRAIGFMISNEEEDDNEYEDDE